MALVIQSFGNETEYRRAIFAVLSYYAQHDARAQKTILYTDNPAYFVLYFNDLPVQYELLTIERIRGMRGEIDFLHRMKIAIIEHAFKISGEDILYADSDTFFLGDTKKLMQQLSPSCSFMHLKEYAFESLMEMKLPAGRPFHEFVNIIRSEKIKKHDGSSITISDKQYSWNAGVMILHRSVVNLLPDVYALTDQFYPKSKNHASEQYAFSIVLQNALQLKHCDDVIYHYWHRVKKSIVDIFLAQNLTLTWSKKNTQEKVADVRMWTLSLVKSFESHILTLRDNSIQAFHENKFREAFSYAARASLKDPFNIQFAKDLAYHTKRWISLKLGNRFEK
jgi:hypothetical protein